MAYIWAAASASPRLRTSQTRYAARPSTPCALARSSTPEPTTSWPRSVAASHRWRPAKPNTPVTRIRTFPSLRLLGAPVVERIGQRALEGNVRRPPGRPLELAAVAEQHLHVGGPQALGILAHFD